MFKGIRLSLPCSSCVLHCSNVCSVDPVCLAIKVIAHPCAIYSATLYGACAHQTPENDSVVSIQRLLQKRADINVWLLRAYRRILSSSKLLGQSVVKKIAVGESARTSLPQLWPLQQDRPLPLFVNCSHSWLILLRSPSWQRDFLISQVHSMVAAATQSNPPLIPAKGHRCHSATRASLARKTHQIQWLRWSSGQLGLMPLYM